MTEQRRHRLELPGVPQTDDPMALKKYLTDLRRLTMDEFNRMATDLFTFKEEVANSAGFTLQAVANIAHTVTQYSATFTWTLPTQPQVTPTSVRVRIAEFGDAWAEFPYPLETWSINALLPGTEYTFQIQLVYQGEVNQSFVSATRNCPAVPTLVESTSEIRSRSFTTDSGVGPPGDGGGGDTDFPIPDVDGTPGTGGAGTDCHWEWKTQIASESDGTWSDTGDTGTADGDAGSITLDTTATGLDYSSTRLYRLCIREVCDGVAVGDGSYQCGDPWPGDHDWTDACAGVGTSSSSSATPFGTADLMAIPRVCLQEDLGLTILEDVADLEVIQGDAFQYVVNTDNEWYMKAGDLTSKSNYWGQMGWVLLPLISALNNSDDVSFSLSYKVDTLFPSGGVVLVDPLLSIGQRIIISLRSDGTNYGFQVTMARETGGNLVMTSPLSLTVDNAFHEVVVSSDADGNKLLIVDREIAATNTEGVETRLDNNDGNVRIYGTTEGSIGKMYGWNRALTLDDLPTAPPAEDIEVLTTDLTTSQTPTADALQILVVAMSGPASSTNPTPHTSITGCGLSFDLIDGGIARNSGITRIGYWIYRAQSSSTSTGTLSFSGGSGNLNGVGSFSSWIEVRNATVGSNGADAVVQYDFYDGEGLTPTSIQLSLSSVVGGTVAVINNYNGSNPVFDSDFDDITGTRTGNSRDQYSEAGEGTYDFSSDGAQMNAMLLEII